MLSIFYTHTENKASQTEKIKKRDTKMENTTIENQQGYIERDDLYEEPLAAQSAMWTDLYELTMAQTLFLEGRHNQEAVFQGFIRQTPYNAEYLVTAGQNIISEWLDKNWKFTDRDIKRLARKTIKTPEGEKPIFKPEFLEMLKNTKLEITLDMMDEGELAFPTEPIYKVSGPIWQCLAIEGAILNTMNSQSNFATYASILKEVANGKPVAEFGLRRAQAVGGLSPTRGAYVGGADASSNCWAETVYGINTVGTMAHAYVMLHDDELDAFANWAEHNPYLGAFLVDTYDTIEGVKRAVKTCQDKGIKISNIRLDSGDLLNFSKEARKIMDEAGFTQAKIIVSNDLDTAKIEELEKEGAAIDLYAVGTNLVTAKEQPALGGVYKIATAYDNAITHEEIEALKKAVKQGAVTPDDIRDRVTDIMKLSNDEIKMTYPGELDLIRVMDEDGMAADIILSDWQQELVDENAGQLKADIKTVERENRDLTKIFNKGAYAYRPLNRIFNKGELVGAIGTVHTARDTAIKQLKALPQQHKDFKALTKYPVYIDEKLAKRQRVMAKHLKTTGNAKAANQLKIA